MNPIPEATPFKGTFFSQRGRGQELNGKLGIISNTFPGHLNTNSPKPHSYMNTVAVCANHFRGKVSALSTNAEATQKEPVCST